jgi:hypothetical protein
MGLGSNNHLLRCNMGKYRSIICAILLFLSLGCEITLEIDSSAYESYGDDTDEMDCKRLCGWLGEQGCDLFDTTTMECLEYCLMLDERRLINWDCLLLIEECGDVMDCQNEMGDG